MSKRIITEIGDDPNPSTRKQEKNESIRVYEPRCAFMTGDIYAVIIADDNIFEGL